MRAQVHVAFTPFDLAIDRPCKLSLNNFAAIFSVQTPTFTLGNHALTMCSASSRSSSSRLIPSTRMTGSSLNEAYQTGSRFHKVDLPPTILWQLRSILTDTPSLTSWTNAFLPWKFVFHRANSWLPHLQSFENTNNHLR